jgi:hypothetical protein
MSAALDVPSGRSRLAMGLRAIRTVGRGLAVAVRTVISFWNIPPLGEIAPNRSPLLRHNWYI